MKEDDIIQVFERIQLNYEKTKNLKLNETDLRICYRFTTGNISATSYREFIITAKSFGILRTPQKNIYLFEPEKFNHYKKMKKEIGF